MTNRLETGKRYPFLSVLTAAGLIGAAGLALPAQASLFDVTAGTGLTGSSVTAGGVRYEVIRNEVVNSPWNKLLPTGTASATQAYAIDNVYYGSNANDIFSAVGGIRVRAGSAATLDSFNQPTNTVDITSTTAGTLVNTVTPQNINGINTSLDYFMSATSPTLRVFGTFTNTGQNDIIVDVGYGSNLGSNVTTVLQATSSGDTAFQADDRWLVSGDSSGVLPSLTFVRFGPDGQMAFETPGVPGITSNPPTFSSTQNDYYADIWKLSLAPGATQSLMWFMQFSDTLGIAEANASMFANRQSLETAGLLSGLSMDQRLSTANWDLPEPDAIALIVIGALGTFAARRKKQ